MREDTAPDQVQPPNVHWAQVVSDEPIEIHVGTGKPITELIRAIREAEVLRKVPVQIAPICGSILLFMVDCVNGREYQKSRRLICWPSRAYLAWHMNRCIGHIARGLAALVDVGVLVEVEPGGGTKTTRWELVSPELTPSAPARRVPARRRAVPQRAGALQKPEDGNLTKETISNNNTPGSSSSTTTAPADQGRVAAAAAELEGLGIEPEEIEKLIGLATTTRERVMAWALEAKDARHLDSITGFVVGKLRKGTDPPENRLRQARQKLKRFTSIAPGAEQPAAPADRNSPEWKEAARRAREALAQAKAGEA